MGRLIEQSHGDQDGWRILFEEGMRGFAARIGTVVESFQLLDKPFSIPFATLSPEQWAVDSDSRIGEIFFGMDSALECIVFALNAIGYLKSPGDFCDIKTAKGLKQVCPDNIATRICNDKHNPRRGYAMLFPRIRAHWSANNVLIASIVEYHDVSKHRSCIVSASSPSLHSLSSQPKEPGSVFRSGNQDVESIVGEFHDFSEKLLIKWLRNCPPFLASKLIDLTSDDKSGVTCLFAITRRPIPCPRKPTTSVVTRLPSLLGRKRAGRFAA
jgi:hypothetical protein